MTQEEKAKAYDKALERANEQLEGAKVFDYKEGQIAHDIRTTTYAIFPELKEESEDEKVRKEIISFIQDHIDEINLQVSGDYDTRDKEDIALQEWCKKAIAWLEKQGEKDKLIKELGEYKVKYTQEVLGRQLEKQGEQKFEMKTAEESLGISSEEYNDIVNECLYGESNSSDKEEPKFKVGDWVVDGNFVTQITGIEDDGYTNSDQGFISFETAKNFHLWTIKDAKDGDVLAVDSKPFIYNGSKNEVTVGAYCGFNSEHKFSFAYNYVINQNITPATKEQHDTLMKAMADAGWEFDFEKKELKKIEKNIDVNHEYFSDLLEKDESDNIDDYAYQCAYCMSHDWMKDTATWDDVQKACKLGAEWKEKHLNNSLTAWSEEDTFRTETLISVIKSGGSIRPELRNEFVDWLKSIKERVQPIHEYSDTEKQEMFLRSQRPHFWKPSDEQMKALKYVAYHLMPDNNYREEMFSLYEDLKKLK